jgi:hypothetical protein
MQNPDKVLFLIRKGGNVKGVEKKYRVVWWTLVITLMKVKKVQKRK